MKWVLLWIAMGSAGSLTSGSAQFDTPEACAAAQKLHAGLGMKLSMTSINIRSVCVISQNGEHKDALAN